MLIRAPHLFMSMTKRTRREETNRTCSCATRQLICAQLRDCLQVAFQSYYWGQAAKQDLQSCCCVPFRNVRSSENCTIGAAYYMRLNLNTIGVVYFNLSQEWLKARKCTSPRDDRMSSILQYQWLAAFGTTIHQQASGRSSEGVGGLV